MWPYMLQNYKMFVCIMDSHGLMCEAISTVQCSGKMWKNGKVMQLFALV